MRVIIQRVNQASVSSEPYDKNSIGQGMLVLLGIEEADNNEDIEWLCGKIARLRIFADESGIMNRSIVDIAGEILVVSQFTLHASTRKGNRPSYIRAAHPSIAQPLYLGFVESLRQTTGLVIKTGWFGAHMMINLDNDGPVTIMIDSKLRE